MRLVTGGTGMVGSAIKADLKIGSKDYDLTNWVAVNDLFEKYPEEGCGLLVNKRGKIVWKFCENTILPWF